MSKTSPKTAQFAKSVCLRMAGAVWLNNGKEVYIGAPTLPALEIAWKKITDIDLDRALVQDVIIVGAGTGESHLIKGE